MEERRKSDPEFESLRELIREHGEALKHISEQLAIVSSMATCVAEGFPGRDAKAHREYHEALMRKVEARTEFFQKLLFELTKLGIVGFTGWAAITLWRAASKI